MTTALGSYSLHSTSCSLDSTVDTPTAATGRPRLLNIDTRAALGSGVLLSFASIASIIGASSEVARKDRLLSIPSSLLSSSCSLDSIFDSPTGAAGWARFLNIDTRAFLGSGSFLSSCSTALIIGPSGEAAEGARLLSIAIKAALGSSLFFSTSFSSALHLGSLVDVGFERLFSIAMTTALGSNSLHSTSCAIAFPFDSSAGAPGGCLGLGFCAFPCC